MAPPAAGPGGRWRTPLLILSLALNLFLGGLLIGGWIAGRPPGGDSMIDGPMSDGPIQGLAGDRPGSAQSTPGLHRLIGALSPEARPEARRVFQEHRRELRTGIIALAESRRRVAAALSAEPFDPASLAAAFEELRHRTGAVQAGIHDGLVELSVRLNPEDRRRLVEFGARLTGERHGGRGGPPFRPPPDQ